GGGLRHLARSDDRLHLSFDELRAVALLEHADRRLSGAGPRGRAGDPLLALTWQGCGRDASLGALRASIRELAALLTAARLRRRPPSRPIARDGGAKLRRPICRATLQAWRRR